MDKALLKQAFEDARKGKTIGGIGGIKEFEYKDFDEWHEKTHIQSVFYETFNINEYYSDVLPFLEKIGSNLISMSVDEHSYLIKYKK